MWLNNYTSIEYRVHSSTHELFRVSSYPSHYLLYHRESFVPLSDGKPFSFQHPLVLIYIITLPRQRLRLRLHLKSQLKFPFPFFVLSWACTLDWDLASGFSIKVLAMTRLVFQSFGSLQTNKKAKIYVSNVLTLIARCYLNLAEC